MKKKHQQQTLDSIPLQTSKRDSLVNLQELETLSNVQIKQLLGKGNFGAVYLAVWNGTPVAAKKLNNKEEWNAFLREASILR